MKERIWLSCIVLTLSCQAKQKQGVENNSKIISNSKESKSKVPYNYDTYCNARFGYCIDYPQELLAPQPESENGDGRIFTTKEGVEILRVYGLTMLDPDGVNNLEQQFNKDLNDNLKVTYKKLGRNFFVISGYKNGKVYYQKMIANKEGFANAILQYNIKDSAVFNSVAASIAQSFH